MSRPQVDAIKSERLKMEFDEQVEEKKNKIRESKVEVLEKRLEEMYSQLQPIKL